MPIPKGSDYYELTPRGEKFIQEEDLSVAIPIETGKMMAEVSARFGDEYGLGFVQRSSEAVSCYQTLNLLACCAMCSFLSPGPKVSIQRLRPSCSVQVRNKVIGTGPDGCKA